MILMHKNEPVAEIELLGTTITKYGKIYNKELLPIGTVGHKLVEPQLLRHWCESRCIPNGRPLNSKYFENVGVDKSSCLVKSMGFSLTDRYWFKSDNLSDVLWEDINFHDNGFVPVFAKSLQGDDIFGPSPDFVTDGAMDKFWYLSGGVPTLAKIDSFKGGLLLANELVYKDIAYLAGIRTTPYFISEIGKYKTCSCPCFIEKSSEKYISAMQIKHEDLANRVGENLIEYFENDLGFPKEISEMCILDAVLHNVDRHERNFGIIRDDDGTSRFVPLFDNGTCLGVNTNENGKMEDRDMRLLKGSRLDIIQKYSKNVEIEIDETRALSALQRNYELYDIPEERYEIAKKELEYGLSSLEKVKDKMCERE